MKNLINVKSKTDLSGFYIVYHGSTLLEKSGIYGISHLMEHLMCKTFDDLQEKFDEDGITWNAFTDTHIICFHFTGLDQYVNKWKYVLYERLKNFIVTQEMLDNERKIVLEEYKDAFNTQKECHTLNLWRKLYGGYEAIGQRESVGTVTLVDCKEFFDLQFKNPQIINISKKNKFELDEFVISDFKPLSNKLAKRKKNDAVTYEIPNEFKEKTSIIMVSPIFGEKDAAIISFICNLFGQGLKSPLYQEVREKRGLVYYIWCYTADYNKNGSILISTETSNDNVDTLIQTVKEVLENKEKYITQERFDTIKKFHEISFQKNEIERYNHAGKFMSLPNWSTVKLFKQKDFNLQKVYEICDKYFDFDKYYISTDKDEVFE